MHGRKRLRGKDLGVTAPAVLQMHEQQSGVVAAVGVGAALKIGVGRIGQLARVAVEPRRVIEAGTLDLGEVIVEPERLESTRLDIDLVDQFGPRLARRCFSDRPGDLPLSSAVVETGIRGRRCRCRRPALS
jgi:hypothetical protein